MSGSDHRQVVPLAGFNAIYSCADGKEEPGALVKCSEKTVTCRGPLGADTPPVMFFAKVDAEDGCRGGCMAEEKCTAYTWHDMAQGSYAGRCYFRIDGCHDGSCGGVTQAGHQSGYLACSTAKSDPCAVGTTAGAAACVASLEGGRQGAGCHDAGGGLGMVFSLAVLLAGTASPGC